MGLGTGLGGNGGGGGGGAVASVAGRTGAVILAEGDTPNLIADLGLAGSGSGGVFGWLSQAWDLLQNTANVGLVGGTVFLTRVPGTRQPVTKLIVNVTVVGAGLTASQCFAALYDLSGNRLGVTVDQSVAWTSLGLKTAAIVGGPIAVPTGPLYVALLYNGTTGPNLEGINTTAAHANPTGVGTNARAATNATAQTSMPATLTMSSNIATPSNFVPWVAIS